MSDPKRATLITVGASKSEKNKVNKTVRLTINLVESNESKYPELNYKELVIAEERKHRVQNGKTDGLNPFSDNDEDVERVAKKFEQKYGGKSTYGRKGRSKHDDFADIGAGYDENDSFIDNTDGYDEMIPPECDTLYGGFYINSGSLEFKTVDAQPSDDEGPRGRRNKRRLSSSSSSESMESSASDGKRPAVNGAPPPPPGKKNKDNNGLKKAKKVRRTDSSAANSGKQTSDENAGGESGDGGSSRSDSLASKPAAASSPQPSSDSSRDVEGGSEPRLPAPVTAALDELDAALRQRPPAAEDPLVLRVERALCACGAERGVRRAAWARAARALRVSRTKLLQRARALLHAASAAGAASTATTNAATAVSTPAPVPAPTTTHTTSGTNPATHTTGGSGTGATSGKRKANDGLDDIDPHTLSDEHREAKVAETLLRLKILIEERKPGMMASYNAECERVQEERKKLQIASADGTTSEQTKRLPKRRFPWCPTARSLLARLVRLSLTQEDAAQLLAKRALPLFPAGFVRMPTLLRQADLNKELKVSDLKRPRANSSSQPYTQPQPTSVIQPTQQFSEPIHFPPSLTVTTMKPSPEKEDEKSKTTSVFGNIVNSYSMSKDLVIEKEEEKNEDLYIPPNNIGSITITPVVNNTQKTEKKTNNDKNSGTNEKHKQSDGLIRVKSPAALNEMVQKQEKNKALENIHKREKEKGHHKKERSHHNQEKHHHSQERSHNQEKSHHNQEKSHHTEKIHHNQEKSQFNQERSQEKSHHNQERVQHNHEKSHHNMEKSHHNQEKSHHSQEKIHYNQERSQHNHSKEKSFTPLQIDTNFQPKPREPTPSPKSREDHSKKYIENMKIDERNIPRPALIPVHHSPTFAKPDKRPPEIKKKKDILIVSDMDPLAVEPTEPLSIDDSSSDVEVVEDRSDCVKSDSVRSESVPSKDKVNQVKKDTRESEQRSDKLDEATKEDFDSVMKNLRDLEQHSQEAAKFNTSSYGGVITSAKRDRHFDPRSAIFRDPRSDKDKLTSFFEQNGWM